VKKRSKAFVVINLFIILISTFRFVRGVYCYVSFFDTDKDNYYIDENIIINATWELYYDSEYEIASIQIQIWDGLGMIIWNSSRYIEIGVNQDNWNVKIQDLNISIKDNFETIFVKFVNIVIDGGSGNEEYVIIKSIFIEIYKKDVLCELNGFNEKLVYGDDLFFTAKFIDSLNNSNLMYQTVLFRIISSNSTIYQKIFTTNNLGIIELNISSLNHLNIGQNNLIFNITDNLLYNDSMFFFNIFVEKLTIFADILKYNDNLDISDDIEILIYYYYYFNNIIYPLGDTLLEVQFLQDDNLLIKDNFNTNESGILFLNISSNSFSLNEKKNKVTIQVIYNGTEILNSKIINLDVEIGQIPRSWSLNSIQTILILTFSLLGITLSLMSFYFLNKKKSKIRILPDLNFDF
jgi:hypothetical protein